eukprot:6212743-Pleurochrysis_carterae.AAC.2
MEAVCVAATGAGVLQPSTFGVLASVGCVGLATVSTACRNRWGSRGANRIRLILRTSLQCIRKIPRATHFSHALSVLAQAHCRSAARFKSATALDVQKEKKRTVLLG